MKFRDLEIVFECWCSEAGAESIAQFLHRTEEFLPPEMYALLWLVALDIAKVSAENATRSAS